VAFRPEQVKSIWNGGEFGIQSRDIMASTKAWHGTGKMIERFQSKYIGTGEGAQAYGWGMYFTDLEDIARYYAETIGNRLMNQSPADPMFWWLLDGKAVTPNRALMFDYLFSYVVIPYGTWVGLGETGKADADLKERMLYWVENAIENTLNQNYTWSKRAEKEYSDPGKTILETFIAIKNDLQPAKDIEFINVDYPGIPRRYVYQVQLRNGRTLSDLVWMDWRNPVPDALKKKIIDGYYESEVLMGVGPEPTYDNAGDPFEDELPERIWSAANGGTIYSIIKTTFARAKDPDPAKAASMFLAGSGIDGIRYPANSMSGGITNKYNYVVFDEDNIEIESLYRFSAKAAFPNNPAVLSSGGNYWQSAMAYAQAFWQGRSKNWKATRPETSVMDRILSLPSHYFKKVPAMSLIFDAAIRYLANRHHYQNMIFNSSKDPSVSYLEDLAKFRKEEKQEYDTLNQYLFDNDRDQIGYKVKKENKRYKVLDPRGKFVKDYKTRYAAWISAFRMEAKDYRKSGHSAQAAHALFLIRFMNFRSYLMLEEAFRGIIRYCQKNKKPYPKFTYWVYRKNKKGQYKKVGVKVDLMTALKRIHDRSGYYMPRIRESGKYKLFASKQGANSILQFYNFRSTLNKAAEELEKQGYTVEKDINSNLPGEIFKDLENPMKIEEIINKAMAKVPKAIARAAKSANLPIQMAFAESLIEQVADVMRSHASTAFRIKRTPAKGKDVVIGYKEDMIFATVTAGRAIANGYAKRLMARDMYNAITGRWEPWNVWSKRNPGKTFEDYSKWVYANRIDPGKQPNAYKDALTYMSDMLRNNEFGDRVIGFLQGLAMLKYLGMRIAAPLINLTVLPTNVVACMKGYAHISIRRSMALITGAIKDYFQWWRDPHSLDPGTRKAMLFIHDMGWHEAQFNRESMKVLSATLPQKYDWFVDKAMWMFKTSEKVNRVATILATARGLLKGRTFDQLSEAEFYLLMNRAHEISDSANGIYGKANYPMLLRGEGYLSKTGRAFYMFKTFAHNFLLTALDLGLTKREWTAMMYMLFSPGLIAGAGAALPLSFLFALLRQFTDDDPEEAFMEFVQEGMGDEAEMFARYGLAGLLNVNIKGSLRIDLASIPTNLSDVMGAPFSVWEDVAGGIENFRQGNYMKGAEMMLPLAGTNILKALREFDEGLTTKGNTPVYYGNQRVRANLHDAFLRFISLNPARISRIHEKQYYERMTETEMQETRSEIYSRFRRYFLANPSARTKEAYVDLLREMQEYNQQVRILGRRDIPFITKEGLKSAIRQIYVPPKKERLRYNESLRSNPSPTPVPAMTLRGYENPTRSINQWAAQ
jgi:hypothetical protein